MTKDVLFIFTNKSQGMILDCRKTGNDQYEILTKCHGLLRVNPSSFFDTLLHLCSGHWPAICSATIVHDRCQAWSYSLTCHRRRDQVDLSERFLVERIVVKNPGSIQCQVRDSWHRVRSEPYWSFRIDEQNIIDIQFLPGHAKPTFVILHPVGRWWHPDLYICFF